MCNAVGIYIPATIAGVEELVMDASVLKVSPNFYHALIYLLILLVEGTGVRVDAIPTIVHALQLSLGSWPVIEVVQRILPGVFLECRFILRVGYLSNRTLRRRPFHMRASWSKNPFALGELCVIVSGNDLYTAVARVVMKGHRRSVARKIVHLDVIWIGRWISL